MKIAFTPTVSYTQAQKINKTENPIIQNQNKSINELPKNSMAELLGRTQTVSFRGENSQNGAIIEHTCTERFTLNGTKEKIRYNKETGDYVHTVTDKSGNLISKEEYFPSKSAEIITSVDEEGITTRRTTTPDYTLTEEFFDKDHPLLIEYSDITGKTYTETTDYERQRKVIRKTQYGVEQPVEVYDISEQGQGKRVYSGELVIDTRYDENADLHITENIITKDVLRKARYSKKGMVLYLVDYNPQTGHIIREIHYNNNTKSSEERTYTGVGRNLPVKTTITSHDGNSKQEITYKPDGKTIASNILYSYGRNGTVLLSEEKYKDDTTIIEEKVVYGNNGGFTQYFYKESPNVPEASLSFDENKRMVSETLYRSDGKTPKLSKEYRIDNRTIEKYYGASGRVYQRKIYSPNNKLEYIHDYNPRTGALKKITQFDQRTGHTIETVYDEFSRTAVKRTETDRNGNTVSYTEFHDDGETPKYKREYHFDGTYTDTEYDEYGNLTFKQEYEEDGRKKQNYKRRNYGSSQYTNPGYASYQNYSSQPKTEKESAFITRIGAIFSSRDKDFRLDVQEADWIRLSKILGLDSVESVKEMKPETFRKLAAQYHPDKVPKDNPELLERNVKLFQIISTINAANNRKRH